jgi:hypothetical protein
MVVWCCCWCLEREQLLLLGPSEDGDLGIILSSDLFWADQVNYTVKQAKGISLYSAYS